ncbi:MAG: 4Fe-4S ferredoxin [Campylobacteraceae bacterium]|nr:4Fe-4S ferredoxin [Campylobacteraceae bacterium]
MSVDSSKRALFVRKKEPIYPPYFSGKFECLECDSKPCIASCERSLLEFSDGVIKFSPNEKGCNFCDSCAVACEEVGKNTLNLKFNKAINAKALIDINSCLSWNQTICYNCADVCNFKAIDFFGMFKPTINSNCTGCGECIGVCFANSINLKGFKKEIN